MYPHLVPVANRWNTAMGIDVRYPATHVEFLDRCHQAGQDKPTPLLLQYGAGDYNCLHQDLYGEHVFPLQIAILLSEPQKDFTGGEFVMTEQRPRMQSRPIVVPLRQGDGVFFAVHYRPVRRVTRLVSCQSAAWGQPHSLGTTLYGRYHFPRRQVRRIEWPLQNEVLCPGKRMLSPVPSPSHGSDDEERFLSPCDSLG